MTLTEAAESRPERCSRCFRAATLTAFGKWLNGRPVEEPVCDHCAPLPDDVGTLRLYDTWHHVRHQPKSYRVEGIR